MMRFERIALLLVLASGAAAALLVSVTSAQPGPVQTVAARGDEMVAGPEQDALRMIREGRQTFRYDTFGDEAFWGDALQLHRAVAGQKLGGVGDGVSPKTALAVGLKVDMEALPPDLVRQIQAKQVNMDDPATTMALLKLNAVVGVKGFTGEDGQVRSVGITCAICHSTVDNAFAPGIGRRLDGWANRDLDVGKIISLAPEVKPLTDRLGVSEADLKKVLLSWGPGKFDAELLHDGKATRPDGKPAATLLPAAFGLSGVNSHTWTGWGSVTHWNAYVAVTQMRGKGTFFDPRLKDEKKFPIAAKLNEWNVHHEPDLVTAKLPALHFYQLALVAPKPPEGSFDQAAAAQGQILFTGKAKCARCHVPP